MLLQTKPPLFLRYRNGPTTQLNPNLFLGFVQGLNIPKRLIAAGGRTVERAMGYDLTGNYHELLGIS